MLLRGSDGGKLEQFEASRHRGRSGQKVLVVRTDDAWTVERHNDTTTCRSANIWYTVHDMYLIIRVTSTQRITHNNIINVAEGTSINNN
jgi:hypothetical protein